MIIAIAIVVLLSPLAVFTISNPQNASTTEASSVTNSDFIRIACVGDSITANSGYPVELQSMLGANYTVGNFGVGESTVSLNSWKPYMNQPEFQNAVAFMPNIVVILLGTNDDLESLHQYNETFQEDYTKLITSFQQLETNPDILIANQPPIFNNSSDLSPTYLTNIIIPKTEALANKMNIPVIDLYNAFGNHTDYFEDGVHPNSKGATVIASEVFNMLSTLSAFKFNQIT